MILPARQLAPAPLPDPEPELTWAAEVARFFHTNRSKRKEKPIPEAMAKLRRKLPRKWGPGDRPGPQRKQIEDLD